MSRWDILDRNNVREAEPRPANEGRRQQTNGTTVSVGRGPAETSSATTPERPDRQGQNSPKRSPDRRTKHRDGDRTYSLRSSEIVAMTDIGMFRTIDVRDL